MKKIEINPMTRLEGHGKIAIFLDDAGNVDEAFFQVVEFRGFEKFLVGLPIEEVPRTVSTICGVCRGVHFTAAMKASDQVYGVQPTAVARKLRELFFNAHYVEDHAVVLYALGFPDFVVGPGAPAAERNVVGLINAVGAELGRKVLQKRGYAVKIFEMLGGKPNHPVSAIPGGWSKTLNEVEREQIEGWAHELVDLSKLTLQIFSDVVLSNPGYMELVTGDMYKVPVNYMGSVDENGHMALYDGTQKVVDVNGNELYSFKGMEYIDHISERVLPWTYLKMPYQKKIGWKGIVDGEGTSLYSVGPLARFNVANGLSTPLANEEFQKFFTTFGGKPVHNIMGYHWARAIEMLHCSERILELARDPEITSDDARAPLGEVTGEGVGIIEAPRGTLIHHYNTDENGIVTDANIVVATTHNKGPINLAVRKAAKHFIKDGNVDEGILNHVEMAYRPYDLCLGCATHAVKPGSSPIEIKIYDSNKELSRSLKNF
ncbi:Ni/Fe hydrogenase subunit alpha [Desulfopila inferna]|uniref:Ni/Fe hydrogenase subunit alpha n=1 Tax=Desulfopila inferna TaxID=468528 RepID=UPI00196634CD|nr:Ni/Fe hydrogenase subunit alpha [Desulfopila inferna]